MPMMSPRTQSFTAQGMPNDQAKSLFDQGLSQMAYNVLIGKLPHIAQDVVTFKVLESDPEEGSGVGAFVVMRGGQTLYIPVVMADNQVKPLDILYYKDLNVFLPLTKEWLAELDKLSVDEMGQGVTPPDTLSTDVDIRNTVIPPTTGRYSYASDLERQAGRVFDEARNQRGTTKLAFLDFLTRAPNRVKRAAARVFETQPRFLKKAVYFYGAEPLTTALTLQKEADYGNKLSRSGGLYIADKSTKPGEFKSVFGPKAPLAFSGVTVKGYYAKDDRKRLNRPLKVQRHIDLQEPRDSGAYKIWGTDGKPVVALLIANPIDLFRRDRYNEKLKSKRLPARNVRFVSSESAPADPLQGSGGRYRVPSATGTRTETAIERIVGVTEDGKLIDVNHLVGEQVSLGELEGSKVYQKTVSDKAKLGAKVGQRGIFVQTRGQSFNATAPLTVEKVTSASDGVKRIEVSGGLGVKTLVVDENSPLSRMTVPASGTLVYMPSDYVFLPVRGELTESDLMTRPEDVFCWAHDELEKSAAAKVIVKYAADRGWTFGATSRESFTFVPALRKLAVEAHIAVEDAEQALKEAQEGGRFEFFLAPAGTKLAAGEQPAPEEDPAQMAMDQVQPAPMAPAGPSPVDMAVAEQMQNLQMQMQGIQTQMGLLQNIQMRTQMIAGGGGAMGSPAAAAAAMGGPMDPAMMGGGAAPAPQGMDPAMGAGAQPPGSPVMQQMRGAQASMGGMQPGMDPSMQQMGGVEQEPPPGAMMNSDDGSVDTLATQVNPQFMEQAGALNDAGTFDAAALASMAQAPSLKDMVGGYLPNLEKSLDNVGRVLLTLWMDERRIKADIGDETYIALEDNLRSVFRNLGDLILKVNQNTLVMRDANEPNQMQE